MRSILREPAHGEANPQGVAEPMTRDVLETGASGETKGRYLRGVNLIAQIIDASLCYYLFNAHGDVVQQIMQNGIELKTYRYDAWGAMRQFWLAKQTELPARRNL